MKVWSWRQLILQSDLESTTKLVLLVISTYMNEHGGGCYPSVPTIARGASLSQRAVTAHLQKAESAGYLVKRPLGKKGRLHSKLEFLAAWPEPELPLEIRGEPGAPQNGGNEMHPITGEGVNQVQGRGEPGAPKHFTEHSPYDEDTRRRAVEIFEWLEKFFDPVHPWLITPVYKWLEEGADFEADIKAAALQYKKKREQAPRCLTWLNDNVRRSIQIRTSKAPEMDYSAHNPDGTPKSKRDKEKAQMIAYAKNRASINQYREQGKHGLANLFEQRSKHSLQALAEYEKINGPVMIEDA